MSDKLDQQGELACIQNNKLYGELELKKIQLWDLEEENRILQRRISELQSVIKDKNKKIEEYEAWCKHLQSSWDKEKLERRIEEQEIINKYFYSGIWQKQDNRIAELEKWCIQQQECLVVERNARIAELEKWNTQRQQYLIAQHNAKMIEAECNVRIAELERWCAQQQEWLDKKSKRNVIRKIMRRIKNIFLIN